MDNPEREQLLRDSLTNAERNRRILIAGVSSRQISPADLQNYDDSVKDVEVKVKTLDDIKKYEEQAAQRITARERAKKREPGFDTSTLDRAIAADKAAAEKVQKAKASILGPAAPFVNMAKGTIDVTGAVKAGVSDKALRGLGVSQIDIVKTRQNIAADKRHKEVDREVRKIRQEETTIQPVTTSMSAAAQKAFKKIERYYDPETGSLKVFKAVNEGIPWETVKEAGFDISKKDYNAAKLSFSVLPDKPVSYQKAEEDFDKAAQKIWKMKGLSDAEKAQKAMETKEWQQLQNATAAYNQTFEAGIMSKEFAVVAAEVLVPGLYVARHWNEMSPAERGLNIAIDVVSLLPLAGAVTRGARAGATFGRAAMAKNIIRNLGAEITSQVMAPIDMIIHPVKSAKATGKQILNLAENIAKPKKLPYTVITTTDGTVRIRIDKNTTPAQAIAGRNILMEKAVNGEKLIVNIGTQTVEVATSPFMREARKAGNVLVHTTPDGTPFEKVLTVLEKEGMPASEQGIYFANEPTLRFAKSSAFGKVQANKPTIYLVSKETAQQMKGSNKIYMGTAELERILPIGAKTAGPKQRLVSRIGTGADHLQALLEKPLSASQIARLKSLDLIIESVKAPFTLAIKTKGAKLAGLTDEEVRLLAEELRKAGNVDQARSLLRVNQAVRAARVPARPLLTTTGPVRQRDIISAESSIRDIGRLVVNTPDRTVLADIDRLPDESTRTTTEPSRSPISSLTRFSDERMTTTSTAFLNRVPNGSRRTHEETEVSIPPTDLPSDPDKEDFTESPSESGRVRIANEPRKSSRSDNDSEDEKEAQWTADEIKSAIAWKAGFAVHALKAPYRRGIDEKSFHIDHLPPGLNVLDISGEGSEKKTITVKGTLKEQKTVDVGFTDVVITPNGRGKAIIKSVLDTKGTSSDLTVKRLPSNRFPKVYKPRGTKKTTSRRGRPFQNMSKKRGRQYVTRVGGGEVISRRPIKGRR